MKKYLLSLLLALMAPFCFAQSYPSPTYKNLTVTTTFTATGLVTTTDLATQAANTVLANVTASTASPTAAALPSCGTAGSALNYTLGSGFGCNSSITATVLNGTATFTANPTISTATYYPTVPTNAALQALSTVSTPVVTRLGFYGQNDVQPVNYYASASPCSLNSGNGDNGTQVKSANGLCWLAYFGNTLLNVKEFGAYGDGSHNDTTAMQNAHNVGQIVYYPTGTYDFTSGITISSGGIVGDSIYTTILQTTDTTSANAIVYSSNALGGYFSKFLLRAGATKTNPAAGLVITAATGENDNSQISNVAIQSFPYSINALNAAAWSITDSFFQQFSVVGVQVINNNNPDSGDSQIIGNYFATSVTTAVAISQQSSGGLRVVGNKLNGGGYGYFLGLTAAVSTSDLMIVGNSIENMTTAAIELSRTSGTASFSNITITGNQFAINTNGVVADASGAISSVAITSNTIALSSGTGACVSFGTVTYFTITGNTCLGNGGTPAGIVIAATSGQGKVGPNQYFNLSSTLTNAAGTVWYSRDTQVTTSSVTASTAYGPLFAGNLAVTFPTAFTVTPEVLCTPTTGTAPVSAWAGSVTKTGFTINAIGAASGSMTVVCSAKGVI